jgi:hypothetical protein
VKNLLAKAALRGFRSSHCVPRRRSFHCAVAAATARRAGDCVPLLDEIAAAQGSLSKKKIQGGNPSVPGNDEISPGVSWRLTRRARYPLDPPAVAQFLGPGNWLISKVRVSSLDRARNTIDLVAATIDAPGLVEQAVFGEDLVDSRAPARGSFSPKTS